MNVPEETKVTIDFDDKEQSEAVRTLQPLVFKEDGRFCCVLGPDKQDGVVGYGETVQAALEEWESELRKRIIYPKKNDEVAAFIIDKLNASPKDVG